MQEKGVLLKEEEMKQEAAMTEEERKMKKEKDKKKRIKMNYADFYVFCIDKVYLYLSVFVLNRLLQ